MMLYLQIYYLIKISIINFSTVEKTRVNIQVFSACDDKALA